MSAVSIENLKKTKTSNILITVSMIMNTKRNLKKENQLKY